MEVGIVIAQIAGWLIGGTIVIPFHTMCGIVMAAMCEQKQLGNHLIEKEEQ